MLKRLAFVALAICALSQFFTLLFGLQFADYDLFARLAVGRIIVLTGEVATKDIFSFSQTKEIWYDHEWLSGLLFYLVLDFGKEQALLWLNMALAAVCFCLLYLAQQKFSKSQTIGAILIFLAAMLSVGIWAAVVRAQTFSFLFFAFLLWILGRIRKEGASAKTSTLALIPLVFLIWINSHGGFVVGVGLLGVVLLVSLIEKRPEAKKLFATCLLSAITPMLNPYGLGYIKFLYEAIGKSRPLIDEWNSVPLNPLEMLERGYVGFLIFAIIFIFGNTLAKSKVSLEGRMFCAFALIFGFFHVRLLPFFYCAMSVYFLPAIVFLVEKIAIPRREALFRVFSTLILFATIPALILLVKSYPPSLNTKAYPVKAMQWLECHYERGNILANFNVGSYLLWRGYPKFLVAVDGRYEEVYPEEVVKSVQIAMSPKDERSDEHLKAIAPDHIIACGHQRNREFPPKWTNVYSDTNCSIYSRLAPSQNKICQESSIWRPNF